jgi:hypothetical protein
MGTEHAYEVLKAMYEHLRTWENFHFLELTAAKRIVVENGRQSASSERQGRRNHRARKPHRYGAGARRRRLAVGGCEKARAYHHQQRSRHRRARRGAQFRNGSFNPPLYEAKFVYYSDTFENKVRTSA